MQSSLRLKFSCTSNVLYHSARSLMSDKRPSRSRKKTSFLGYAPESDEDDFESSPPKRTRRRSAAVSSESEEEPKIAEEEEKRATDEPKGTKRLSRDEKQFQKAIVSAIKASETDASQQEDRAPDQENTEKSESDREAKEAETEQQNKKGKSGVDEDFEMSEGESNVSDEEEEADDHDEEDDDDDDDDDEETFEEFTKKKSRASKKSVTPKTEKPKAVERAKGRGRPKQPPKDGAVTGDKKGRGRPSTEKSSSTKSSSSVAKPTTTVSVPRRPARNPPTSSGANKLGGVTLKSPSAPIRLGLSRNARVGKPLHPNAKSPPS